MGVHLQQAAQWSQDSGSLVRSDMAAECGLWLSFGGVEGGEQLVQCSGGRFTAGQRSLAGDSEMQSAVVSSGAGFCDFADCGMDFGAAGELQDCGHIGCADASGGQDLNAAGDLLLQLLQHGRSLQRGAAAATGEHGLEAEVDEL
jgi:hypothetical protein